MKTSILIFLTVLFINHLHSQDTLTIERQVIATAGGYAVDTDSGLSLSWTIGEPITETVYGNTLILTQGFQQPDSLNTVGTNVKEVPLEELGLKVFPNPAAFEINIQIAKPEMMPLWLRVFDSNGRMTFTRLITQETSTLDVSSLASGSYYLHFYSSERQLAAAIKLLKSN
ncbi:MAG: T9SS type A sorting domain-containing protein [Phaeodactylibacter sp.]|nr:T9SS type A sorting domain-containing protein [Phaeodactylibacter sp.]